MTSDDKTSDDKRGGRKPGETAPESERPSAADPVTHFPAAGRAKACPNCGKPVKLETRPFCSKRCADIDLGRWLGEAYRIPAEEPPDGGQTGEEGGPDGPASGRGGRRGD